MKDWFDVTLVNLFLPICKLWGVGNMMLSVVLDGNPLDEDDGNLLDEVVPDGICLDELVK